MAAAGARRISSLLRRSLRPDVSAIMTRNLRIAVIGQSVFAKDVYNLIRKNGHTVVGVFTIPDKNGREVKNNYFISIFFTILVQDPVATAASQDGVPVFKFPGWRRKGIVKVGMRSGVFIAVTSDKSHILFIGGGPGPVQECGGRAQCDALLLTVHPAGGGQSPTVQVMRSYKVCLCTYISLVQVYMFPPLTTSPSPGRQRHLVDPDRGRHHRGLQHLLPRRRARHRGPPPHKVGLVMPLDYVIILSQTMQRLHQ